MVVSQSVSQSLSLHSISVFRSDVFSFFLLYPIPSNHLLISSRLYLYIFCSGLLRENAANAVYDLIKDDHAAKVKHALAGLTRCLEVLYSAACDSCAWMTDWMDIHMGAWMPDRMDLHTRAWHMLMDAYILYIYLYIRSFLLRTLLIHDFKMLCDAFVSVRFDCCPDK